MGCLPAVQPMRRQYSDILQGACAGLSWGIYFTAYNNAKIRWQGIRNESTLPAPLHLLSAAEAGCIVSPLTPCPVLMQNKFPRLVPLKQTTLQPCYRVNCHSCE